MANCLDRCLYLQQRRLLFTMLNRAKNNPLANGASKTDSVGRGGICRPRWDGYVSSTIISKEYYEFVSGGKRFFFGAKYKPFNIGRVIAIFVDRIFTKIITSQ